MKRWGLLVATLAMILVTGWVLHRTGWLSRPTRTSHTRITDPLHTAAGWRYRQNQPHHWRYCVLHN
jgi:hypothetical protein